MGSDAIMLEILDRRDVSKKNPDVVCSSMLLMAVS